MRELPVAAPEMEVRVRPERLELLALISIPAEPSAVALSAVIEETDGRKSYWALAHPAAKPDFHHPDSFVHELP